ncbi:MAG TPA: HypC/HybG/HupF family hydrogenase formation chaperone [Thermoanaerobaculia bacterium]|nr:HypC/HybG/HupF family hydrogenase formation chaperone [Thermoanaerobaculia bacterium]
MCLGVPGQVVGLEGKTARVDFWGIHKRVRLDNVTEPVLVGDYIIDHGGYAVRRIPPQDVPDTLALYEVLLSEAGEDPIARDLALELEEALV